MAFPVETKFIDEAERKLGVSFPPDFQIGMAALNGGEVDTGTDLWQLFPFLDSSDKKRLKRTASDIVRETVSARDWAGFPPDAVAIASNGGGDLAILVPSEGEQGVLGDVVLRWDHETGSMTVLSPTTAIWFNTRG